MDDDGYIELEDIQKNKRQESLRNAYGDTKNIIGTIGRGLVSAGKATGSGLQKMGQGFQKFQASAQKSEWGKRLKSSQAKPIQPFFGMHPPQKNPKKPRGIPKMWAY